MILNRSISDEIFKNNKDISNKIEYMKTTQNDSSQQIWGIQNTLNIIQQDCILSLQNQFDNLKIQSEKQQTEIANILNNIQLEKEEEIFFILSLQNQVDNLKAIRKSAKSDESNWINIILC